ncbi:MAG: glycosyltransferase [Candidatus Thorarchaeota archaeon]
MKKICFLRFISLDETIGYTETLDLINYLAQKSSNKIFFICLKGIKKSVNYKFTHNYVSIYESPSLRSLTGKNKFTTLVDLFLYSFFSLFVLMKIRFKERIDVIHYYPESSFTIFLYKCFYSNICYILDVRKPILVQAEEMESNRCIKQFIHIIYSILEKISISVSDLIVSITKGVKIYLEKRMKGYKLKKKQIFTLPCSVDLSIFKISESDDNNLSKLKQEFKIKSDSKILLYLGSGSKVRDFDKILRIFDKLIRVGYDLTLLIIGDLDYKLKKYCEKLKISSYIREKKVKHNNVPMYIRLADICLSYLPDLPTFKYSCPLKILEYMAMKKPVIATNIYAHKMLIKNKLTGILTECNEEDFMNAIKDLIKYPEKAKKLGENARAFIEKRYTLELIGSLYESFLIKCKKLKENF